MGNNTTTGEYSDRMVFYTNAGGGIELADPDVSVRDGWFRMKELESVPRSLLSTQPLRGRLFPLERGTPFTFSIALCVPFA